VRKLGGTTIRSIGHISRLQRITDNDIDKVAPADMLAELLHDNRLIVGEMRHVHALCDEQDDVSSASLLKNWIDEAEGRGWFLDETARHHGSDG
jgi:starvation-inducible DNA-binding protein